MVSDYLDTRPDPATYEFLQHDFDTLTARHASVVATSFRAFPSYPQRFTERLQTQPVSDASLDAIEVEPWRVGRRRERYTEVDLHVRQFMLDTSRCVAVKRATRAA
jgi:hypothetical protein